MKKCGACKLFKDLIEFSKHSGKKDGLSWTCKSCCKIQRNKWRTCGVYKITNIINGKFYIGSSVNIKARWDSHRSHLKTNVHHCILLQNQYNKYGKDSFKYEVLEDCSVKERFKREQYYMDLLTPPLNHLLFAGSQIGIKQNLKQTRQLRESLGPKRVSIRDTRVSVECTTLGLKFDSIKECSEYLEAQGYHITDGMIANSIRRKGKSKGLEFKRLGRTIDL